ncbi:MAG TPA: hypothetical protein VFE96_01610 [Candidatus Bathyarchaeia archaeon]|nr:hypothetical protein [Candidatus Bathyarchaeia archaeon]
MVKNSFSVSILLEGGSMMKIDVLTATIRGFQQQTLDPFSGANRVSSEGG